jgi:hypothetical protein
MHPITMLTRLRPEFSGKGQGIGGTKLSFEFLLYNPHPAAFAILKPDLDRLVDPTLGQSYFQENMTYIPLLSINTGTAAVEWLVKNPRYIDDMYFSQNLHQAVLAYYATYPHHINWRAMSANPSAEAVVLMREYRNYVCWRSLSLNNHPDAVEFLMETPENIQWDMFSGNESAKAVAILRENRDRIRWPALSINCHPDAVALLLETPENIVYRWFLENSAPEALLWNRAHLHLIRPGDYLHIIDNKNPDAVVWLSEILTDPSQLGIFWKHPSIAAFDFIRKNKIPCQNDYDVRYGVPSCTSKNPDIFEDVYDYASIRANMDLIREDLARACAHPTRLIRHLEAGGDPDDF